MKAFFEEYGFIVLSAIVVLLLVGMASPIGEKVKESTIGIVDSLTTKTTTEFGNTNSNIEE